MRWKPCHTGLLETPAQVLTDAGEFHAAEDPQLEGTFGAEEGSCPPSKLTASYANCTSPFRDLVQSQNSRPYK